MKFLLRIFYTIFISSIITFLISIPIEYLVDPNIFNDNYGLGVGAILFWPLFYMGLYLAFGLPITLVANFVTSRKAEHFSSRSEYLIQLVIYTVWGLTLVLLIDGIYFELVTLGLILPPLYLYLHVLLMVKKVS